MGKGWSLWARGVAFTHPNAHFDWINLFFFPSDLRLFFFLKKQIDLKASKFSLPRALLPRGSEGCGPGCGKGAPRLSTTLRRH